MKKKISLKNKLLRIISIVMLFVFFILFNNSSLFVNTTHTMPKLLAHRGLAQTFDVEEVKWNTNTARIIHQPEHPFLENTIPSIEAAFAYGADIVEFDVRLTKDNILAVFHDYTLEFRTDGKGNVSDYTMDELKQLDVGYGYTADDGKTFPFRGTGVGMMPSIDEIFAAFPDNEFLIHIKDGGEQAGILLDEYFQRMDDERLSKISVYGNKETILYLKAKYPEMKVLTKSLMINAFIIYTLVGWTGYIPKAIRNIEIHMPLNYAKFLWGWPDRFLKRMEQVNTRFVLVNGTGGFSSGFDNKKDLEKLPDNYYGCIWTNRIDKIAPLYKTTTF